MQILVENRKIRFNYEIMETLDAGIELFGFEVKSLRKKQGSLDGAYVTVKGNEAFLVNTFIPPYQQGNTPKEYDPRRDRRLLFTKKEILSLAGQKSRAGLTAVPILVYNNGRFIKVRIALVRGKKKFDKRETIKRRDIERDLKREFKDH